VLGDCQNRHFIGNDEERPLFELGLQVKQTVKQRGAFQVVGHDRPGMSRPHTGFRTAPIHHVVDNAAARETATHAKSVQLSTDHDRAGRHDPVKSKCTAKSQCVLA